MSKRKMLEGCLTLREDVVEIDEQLLLEWVRTYHIPEDVFQEAELAEWAHNNGFDRTEVS